MNDRHIRTAMKKMIVILASFGVLFQSQAYGREDSGYSISPKGGDMLVQKNESLKFKEKKSDFPQNEASEAVNAAMENYPDGALIKAKNDELEEIKRLENAKQQAAISKDEYEQKKKDAEKEIQLKKRKIEDAKIEQERMQKELDYMSTDLVKTQGDQEAINKDLNNAKQNLEVYAAEHGQLKKVFDTKKSELQRQVEILATTKRESENKIGQLQVDMEKMRRGIAENDSESSRAQNQKAHIEQDLLRGQSEYDAVTSQLAEARQKKSQVMAELNEENRRLNRFKKDLSDEKKELALLESQNGQIASQAAKSRALALAEAKKLELQTAETNTARMSYEAEKAKYALESEKLTTSLVAAKARNQASHSMLEQERSIVLESRFNVEKTKTEISKLDSELKKEKLDNDTLKVKVRNLASMAEKSGLGEEGGIRMWLVTKNCYMRTTSDMASKKMGLVQKDKNVAGQDVGNAVKILNSSGMSLYMPKGCLQAKEMPKDEQ